MATGIRKKVIFISIAILFLALAATTTVSSFFFMREYSAALKSRALLVGSILKYQLEKLLKYDIPLNGLVGFDEQCQEIIDNYPEITSAMVVNLNGRILFHNDPQKRGEIFIYKDIQEILQHKKEELQGYDKNGKNFYNFIIPVHGLDNAPIAAVIIGFPASLITHKTALMVAYSVGVAIIFLTVGGISMVILLQFWVTTPLGQLLRAIMDIRSGGTDSAQLPIIKSKDEFGDLGRAFNEMVLQLKESQDHLKEANEKLRQDIQVRLQAEEALRESEELFRSLVENIALGITLISSDYRIRMTNVAQGELFRKPPSEFVGRECFREFEKRPAVCPHCPGTIAMATGQSAAVETEGKRDDGSLIAARLHAFPSFGPDGEITGFIEVVEDITGRKRAEAEQLRVSKLESLAILAGGIAHDFNNILTAILGNISLAMLHFQKKEYLQERLNEAERACQQAQNLSRQLLTFSKGGAPIKKIVSLKEIAAESASFACSGSRVHYQTSLPDDLWAVEADPGQISQVLHNLVINAIQAMPSGGMVRILGENLMAEAGNELGLDAGRYVKISIQDEGIGISADHLSKIFDPYFTTKQKGSGLGLATAYSIIKHHRGHISVESIIEKGSTFHVYLPASDQKGTQQLKEDGELISGKGKILIMDDEAMVREVLGKMLLTMGYEVESAQDGAQALELYTRAQDTGDPFITVILDLTVPGGMGGKEAMARLLKIDPQINAIVSSGYSDDPVMANFQSYGFTDVIAKPYRISELDKVLKKTLTG